MNQPRRGLLRWDVADRSLEGPYGRHEERGLALRGVKPNDPIQLDGRTGKVVAIDRELNSFTEGLVAAAKTSLDAGSFVFFGN